MSTLIGCGSESSSSNSGSSGTTSSNLGTLSTSISGTDVMCSPTGTTVTISGTVEYERVPVSESVGLDYDYIETLPVRGVVIQALGDNNCVIAETNISDTDGSYELDVGENTNARIYFEAKTVSTDVASWDFEVRDNTRSNGIYVYFGSLVSSETTDSIRNYTIESGWDGSAYTDTRSSAPLAILDTIYDAIQLVVTADPYVAMDDADIFWSVDNSTASGNVSDGDIGTSYYTNDTIYILGKEDSDTDEFDDHVIAHEWGHYFEDNLSRSDGIGGSHSTGDFLDMRIALGEGFGNAFSGMVTDDSLYLDSYGPSQAYSFGFDVEDNANTNPGWYSEGSVQSILYDIFDSVDDDTDVVSLGFSTIYEAMTSDDYVNQASQTSIFSLINSIKTLNSGSSSDIDDLIADQEESTLLGIDTITDNYGSGETHEGYTNTYVANAPYKSIADDGVAVEVCSSKADSQYYNGLGVRQLLRLDVSSAGTYTITATYSQGDIATGFSDPDFVMYLNGATIEYSAEADASTESKSISLSADEYILEVYHYYNLVSGSRFGGTVCFDVTVTAS